MEDGYGARPFPARVLVGLVRFYQRWLSLPFAGMCLYQPTCSHYAVAAIESHGARRGLVLAARRLWRCRSPHPGGLDPVPPAGGIYRRNNAVP